MHDVVRDYLRQHLGPTQITRLHHVLLDAVAADLAHAPSITGDGPGGTVAWWEILQRPRYLREHLVEHLLAADRSTDGETLVTDLRWVQSRLDEAGSLAPFADLSLISTRRAARLARLIGQSAHLLTAADPPYSCADILYSRVDHDPDWGLCRTKLGSGRWPAKFCCGTVLRLRASRCASRFGVHPHEARARRSDDRCAA
jgi:hypothetical protein